MQIRQSLSYMRGRGPMLSAEELAEKAQIPLPVTKRLMGQGVFGVAHRIGMGFKVAQSEVDSYMQTARFAALVRYLNKPGSQRNVS